MEQKILKFKQVGSNFCLDFYHQNDDDKLEKVGTIVFNKYKKVINSEISDNSLAEQALKDVPAVFTFFTQLERAIVENDLLITEEEMENKADYLACLFTMLPMNVKLFTEHEYRSMFHIKKIVLVTDNFLFYLDERDPLLFLFARRVLNHLSMRSKYRTKFLMDERFNRVRRFQHALKKGDTVRLTNYSFNGEKEGVIEAFHITDEFVEHALIKINGKEHSGPITSLQRIDHEENKIREGR